MIEGLVDGGGRALVRIALRASDADPPQQFDAWIDTGFTGELVLPREIIDALGLQESATVDAQLGDGSAVVMASFTCLVEWLGTERTIEVTGSSGRFPLLGVGLLLDNKLTIDYLLREVRVE